MYIIVCHLIASVHIKSDCSIKKDFICLVGNKIASNVRHNISNFGYQIPSNKIILLVFRQPSE